MRISPHRFEKLVLDCADELLASLPPHLRVEAETVLLEIAEASDADLGFDVLGLYEGVPLVERHADTVLLQPDRITLFQAPLQSMCRTEVELRAEIHKTLAHELGHFFGFSEDELEARGWG